MPCPLSWICSSFNPPSFTNICICVEPASSEFSINSFRALAGLWMICQDQWRVSREREKRRSRKQTTGFTSPAAMRLTTVSSSRLIVGTAALVILKRTCQNSNQVRLRGRNWRDLLILLRHIDSYDHLHKRIQLLPRQALRSIRDTNWWRDFAEWSDYSMHLDR